MGSEKQASGVLVVEDNPVNAMVNRLMLQKLGLEVTVAENGLAALEHLRNRRFRLVLMDISMPEMDGVEATRAIRSGKDPDIDSNVAIVGLSAHSLQGDEDESLEAGMNAYLTKPVTLEQLEEIVKRFLAS